jgi:hypothetical protein
MLVSVPSFRDSRPDQPRPLIHELILIHSFAYPALVARPLCTARPRWRDDSARPRRPRSDGLRLHCSSAPPRPWAEV